MSGKVLHLPGRLEVKVEKTRELKLKGYGWSNWTFSADLEDV